MSRRGIMLVVVTPPDRQRIAPVASSSGSSGRRPATVRVADSLRPRPGGRATRVVKSVLDATLQELARLGFLALRVEDVAALASVNKTTVYRRWPTKEDLVIAALREGSRDLDFMPDTGTVRGDMLALLESAAVNKDSTSFRAFISLALSDAVSPEIARLVRVLRIEYRERWISLVRRGIARGELPSTTSTHLLAELVGAVPTVRRLRNDEPLDADSREAIVDLLLAGARACHGGEASRDSGQRALAVDKGKRDGSASGSSRRRPVGSGAARDLRRRAV